MSAGSSVSKISDNNCVVVTKDVALKVIPKKKVKGNEEAVWGEMEVLKGFDHPNIVSFEQHYSPGSFIKPYFSRVGEILRMVRIKKQILSFV